MKAKIILVLPMLALSFSWLSVGFYETRFAEDNRVVFFIKKYPALQVQFETCAESTAATAITLLRAR